MIEQDIFAGIGDDIRKELTKALQRKITECMKNPGQLSINALGNTLVTLCIQNKIEKERFLTEMSLVWDHHAAK